MFRDLWAASDDRLPLLGSLAAFLSNSYHFISGEDKDIFKPVDLWLSAEMVAFGFFPK